MSVFELPKQESARKTLDKEAILIGAAWTRLLLLSIIYGTLLLTQVMQGDLLHITVWQSLNVVMFGSFLLHIPIVEMMRAKSFVEKIFMVALAYDLFALSVMMYRVGVPHSAFLFIYLTVVAFSGFTFGISRGVLLALFGALAFNIVYSVNTFFVPDLLRGTFVIHNFAGLVVAYLGGKMGDEIQFITEDVETKKEVIQKLYDLNQLIVENIPTGLITVDSAGHVIKANKGSLKLFSDLAIEKRSLKELSEPIYDSYLEYVTENEDGTPQRKEIVFYNYRQEKQIYEVFFSTLKLGADGRNTIMLIQNLTEMKNLENAMRQKEKLAAVGQLAAGIAHEIRNPLASISGSIQLLSAGLQTQTAEDKKLFNIVIREIDRLNNLITEFLDFVRPDVKLENPVDVNAIMREILEMVKFNDKLNKKVEQDISFQAQGVVLGNYDKLKQALINIVINAYQAMTDSLKPVLTVKTFDKEGRFVLQIQDTGVGISREGLSRIFEPFHTTKVGGTGLGLAITHKILEAHDAVIDVRSELKKGTTFEIIFPANFDPNADEMYLKKLG